MASASTTVRPVTPVDEFPRVRTLGRRAAPHQDLYYWLLRRGWPTVFLLFAAAFLILNTLFATLYVLRPGCLQNAYGIEDAFYFSVQTLGTIGYGVISPATRYAHIVVSIEALTGVISFALVTGLTFARFARPSARVLFTEKLVVQPRDGVPHLLFRMANWRHNQIVEARLHVVLLVMQRTREGEEMRTPIELALVRNETALFRLSWTAMHRIDEASPFFGPDALDRLRAQHAEIYLSLSGLDETLGASVHARKRYLLDAVVWNARFADILSVLPDGARQVDYRRFHEVELLER